MEVLLTKDKISLSPDLPDAEKSYLACALGRQACMLGYRTTYFAMNRFIEALAAARLNGTYIRWLNQIAKTPLLILDDFGLQPLEHNMN